MPIAITVAGTDRQKSSQCSIVQVDAEQDPAPEQRGGHRVEADRRHRERHGQKHERERGGEATSSSSVPCQRSRWSAAPADVLVADQTPITDAPSDAYKQRVLRSRLEHEERDRGEEHRVDHPECAVERRARKHLEVEPPTHQQQPGVGPHWSTPTRAT